MGAWGLKSRVTSGELGRLGHFPSRLAFALTSGSGVRDLLSGAIYKASIRFSFIIGQLEERSSGGMGRLGSPRAARSRSN